MTASVECTAWHGRVVIHKHTRKIGVVTEANDGSGRGEDIVCTVVWEPLLEMERGYYGTEHLTIVGGAS